METDQAKQLYVLLSQPAKVLNMNCDTGDTDASTTSKRNDRLLSSFDNQDTHIEITMAGKRN